MVWMPWINVNRLWVWVYELGKEVNWRGFKFNTDGLEFIFKGNYFPLIVQPKDGWVLNWIICFLIWMRSSHSSSSFFFQFFKSWRLEWCKIFDILKCQSWHKAEKTILIQLDLVRTLFGTVFGSFIYIYILERDIYRPKGHLSLFIFPIRFESDFATDVWFKILQFETNIVLSIIIVALKCLIFKIERKK